MARRKGSDIGACGAMVLVVCVARSFVGPWCRWQSRPKVRRARVSLGELARHGTGRRSLPGLDRLPAWSLTIDARPRSSLKYDVASTNILTAMVPKVPTRSCRQCDGG